MALSARAHRRRGVMVMPFAGAPHDTEAAGRAKGLGRPGPQHGVSCASLRERHNAG